MILSGDIVEYWGIHKYLVEFAQYYSDIIYVLGNHEYYGSSKEEVRNIVSVGNKNMPSNVRVLNRDVCFVSNQKFCGTTLWFKDDPKTMEHKSRLNDFRRIKDYENWVFEENNSDIHFLQNTVDEDAIVITHHLPTVGAVPKRFVGSPLTGFFLCDINPINYIPKFGFLVIPIGMWILQMKQVQDFWRILLEIFKTLVFKRNVHFFFRRNYLRTFSIGLQIQCYPIKTFGQTRFSDSSLYFT